MTGPTKRTRASSVHDEENELPTPSPSPAPTTPSRRRQSTAPRPSSAQTPSTTPSSSSRPILTRSVTTQPTSHTPLTRSSSMFTPSTRQSASVTPSALPSATGVTTGPSRGGPLVRTQSTPLIPSPASLKSTVSSGGGPGRGKGDDEPDSQARGARRLGKGKENIPPKKDVEGQEEGSRKRLRTGRRSSGADSRTRSGSVSSMRSESVARLPSAAPSSASISRRTSCLPSPSPSPSIGTSRSFDSYSATSLDTLESLDEMDCDQTPTKSSARQTKLVHGLHTPPSSSPPESVDGLDDATQRIRLVRMQSDTTQSGTSTDSDEPCEIRHANPYKHLKAHLRLSTNAHQAIVGREQEQDTLRAYLSDVTSLDVGMYVSGPPGTGKTATVSSVGRSLRWDGWRYVELGCMGLKPTDLWTRLGEQLGCGLSEEDVLSDLRHTKAKTFILLDEIDSLLPPPPTLAPPTTAHLLSKLFSLPTGSDGHIKLVAISNTLDLTLRARLVLPDGATPLVVPFKAYAGSDMINIVASRLAAAEPATGDGVKIDPKAVELLTKKVEAQNGDLRMCLGVLASAISLAEVEWSKKIAAGASIPLVKVSLPHTIKAFNSHTQQLKAAAGSSVNATSSVTGKKIKSVPLQGKMVLVAALVFLTRLRAGLPGSPASTSGHATPTTPTKSSETLTMSSLYAAYVHLLSHYSSPFPPSSESDYRDLVSNLEVLGLVSLGSQSVSMARTASGASARKGAQSQRVELCVREEEVKEGLGLNSATSAKGMAEEEVAKVWEREDGRVRRIKDKVAAAAAASSAREA